MAFGNVGIRTTGEITLDKDAGDDSVTAINTLVGIANTSTLSDEQKKFLQANVEHLEIGVARTDWGGTSLTAWNTAITNGKAKL